MKLPGVVIAIAACSGHAASDRQLAADVATFCGAWQANSRPQRMGELAEYVATRIQSSEMRDAFARIGPDDTSWRQLYSSLHSMLDRVGVTSCPTLEWMEKTYVPELHPGGPTTAELVLKLSASGGVTATDHDTTRTLTDADVELRARAAAERDPKTQLSVIAESGVPLQRVLEIFDAAKRAGLGQFAFGTEAAHLVPLALPRMKADEPTANFVIEFPASGGVYLAGKLVDDAALDAVFQAAAARDPHVEVVVVAEPTVPVGNVVAALGRAQRAGLTSFAYGRPAPEPRAPR